MVKKILSILKNRYVLATIIFLVIIIFFDENNIISQVRLSRKLRQLKQDKEYYIKEVQKDKATMHDLMSNRETLEKLAREKYLMKKDSEDIYVIVKEK